jgi:hypothetical protein
VRIGPRKVAGDSPPLVAIVTNADVAALKQIVAQELRDLQNAVIGCLTKLDPATVNAWTAQAVIITTWLASTPGPFSGIGPGPTLVDYYDQGKALEGVLRDNWYARLKGEGCDVPSPPAPVPALKLSSGTPGSPLAFLESLPPLATALLVWLIVREFKK